VANSHFRKMYVLDVIIYFLKKFLLDDELGDIKRKKGKKDKTSCRLQVSDTERDKLFIN
jgi:hypothetical protein